MEKKINIIRSDGFNVNEFKEIENLLMPYSDKKCISFSFLENSNKEKGKYKEQLSDFLDSLRKNYKIPNNEYLAYLTPTKNLYNYFSAHDIKNVKNYYIQTSDWNHYIKCKPIYPIAYQIVKQALMSLMANDSKKIDDLYHEDLRGCMNDFCKDKAQINFKMRTADICLDCLEIIINQKIDSKIVNQVTSIFERIRFEMLFNESSKNFLYNKIPLLQVEILEELVDFLKRNLNNTESEIQKWIDEDNGKFRKQRCLIFGLDYIDPKREGAIYMSKRFDVLAEQNCESHVIIELKSPNAEIFTIKESKNSNKGKTTEYSMSKDLSRAIPQILGYKREYENMSDEQLQALGINERKKVSECIIVIGHRINNNVWKNHFDDLQKNISVKILTYNDLIEKLENTISNMRNILQR